MKYNMSKIMRRAWEIKRLDSEYIFGLCLRMAWAEAKEAAKVEMLEARFSRWTKTGYDGKKYDRIYFNAEDLGMKVEYYNSGNVSGASIDGEKVSNSEAKRILGSKAFLDLTTGKLHIDDKMEEYFGEKIRAFVA